jgi:Leucine-rich repeat (LRR) protein
MDAHGNRCVTITDVIPVVPWDSLPEVLFAPTILRGLTALHMPHTNMLTLPPSIITLTALKVLDLSHNDVLGAVTEHIGEMVGLRKLQLGYTVLEELPSSIGKLTRLEILDLSCCPAFEALPSSIGKLTRLEILDLSRCVMFEALPEEIGRMVGLRSLCLDDCPLKELPSSIGNLTGLQKLLLGGCRQLERLPASIKQLTRVEILDLWGCVMLEACPEEIWRMVGLRTLNLNFCGVKELLLPYTMWILTSLEELHLDWGSTAVWTCTEELGLMLGLRVLHLRSRISMKVPSSILKLTRLEQLHLFYCESLLATPYHIAPALLLPEEIGEMEGLREISIQYSAAKELPSSIGKLTGLEKLSLLDCPNMKALPEEIGRMVGLRVLDLAECPVGDAGASIIAGMLRTNHCIIIVNLSKCGIQEGGILAIGRAIQETPREFRQICHFSLDGIQLNKVADALGLPVEWGENPHYWSNIRIIRWMLADLWVCDTVIAFLSAGISTAVEEYRPRPLDGSGNSVIPAVSALSLDNMKQIVKLFIIMKNQERVQELRDL